MKEKFLTFKCDRVLEQATQRVWGIPLFGDIQNPPGCDPVQPTIGESTLAGASVQVMFQWSF